MCQSLHQRASCCPLTQTSTSCKNKILTPIPHPFTKRPVSPIYNHQQARSRSIYIYIYAAGCLIEPHFSTLCARNLRKRSAIVFFLIKKWPNFGCQFWGSIKHPWFLAIFCKFFGPLSSGGGSVFLPCVLVPGAHETRGGALFFL